MSIIDETYFIGEINLPTDNTDRTGELQIYIDKSEKKYLKSVLGYELYALFIADLPTPTEQRFTDILNGAEFTNIRTTLEDKWDGLVNAVKESMLGYFSYFEYTQAVQIQQSGNSTTSSNFENSDRVTPVPKAVNAYNLGIDQYNKLYDFLKTNEDDYPEWEFTQLKRVNIFNI